MRPIERVRNVRGGGKGVRSNARFTRRQPHLLNGINLHAPRLNEAARPSFGIVQASGTRRKPGNERPVRGEVCVLLEGLSAKGKAILSLVAYQCSKADNQNHRGKCEKVPT